MERTKAERIAGLEADFAHLKARQIATWNRKGSEDTYARCSERCFEIARTLHDLRAYKTE